MNIKVSVVIATKNEEKHITRCLSSLFMQNYPQNQYDVIIIDAGSDDNTRLKAEKFSVQMVVDTYGTLGHQRNVGVSRATGDYIAFIDADCLADANWLSTHVNALDRCPLDVAAVTGPNLVMNDDPPVAKTIAYMQQTLFGSGGSPQSYPVLDKLASVISATNCNALYRREILLDNPYDNEFGWGEDAEVNFRIRKKGYRFLYNPEAVVWHHRVDTPLKFAIKMFKYGHAMAQIIKKHKRLVRWYAWLPLAFVLYFILLPLILLHIPESKVTLIPLGCYELIVIGVTIQVLFMYKKIFTLITAFLLPIQHVSYGIGMLCGLLAIKRITFRISCLLTMPTKKQQRRVT